MKFDALTSTFSRRATAFFRELRNLSPGRRRQFARDVALLESSGLFCPGWYLDQYRDVREAGISPSVHYLRWGAQEGRIPHPLFDGNLYLRCYPDVRKMNPLIHFLCFGMAEGRIPHPMFEGWDWSDPRYKSLGYYFLHMTKGMENLRCYDAEAPELSIVILNWNKALLTLQCLVSLWRYTAGCTYEIIVVDNGSTKSEVAIFQSVRGPLRLVSLDRNRFFGEGNNIGVEVARGRYLVFMNNDVMVTPNWLPPLLRAVRDNPECGAAGPKFLYPDGRLLEAGACIREDGTVEQRGKRGNPEEPEFNREMRVDYISAATVLMRKETFERVQGFDFRWEPAYYEDADLCLKIAALDLHTYYVPESVVYHHESATTTEHWHELRLDTIFGINQRKFLDRWHPYLLKRNGEVARQCAQLPASKKVVARDKAGFKLALFIPFDLVPGGRERYLFTVAEALLEKHEVWLVTPEKYSRMRVAALAQLFNLDLAQLHVVPLRELNESLSMDVWVTAGDHLVPPIAPRGKHNIFCLPLLQSLVSDEVCASKHFWNGYEQVVVDSRYTALHVTASAQRNTLPPHPIEVISPPLDVGTPGAATSRNPYSILHVGRFFSGEHCQRQDLMIRAFEQIVGRHTGLPFELHFAGSLHPESEDREYFLMCVDLAKNLPIHFHSEASPVGLANLYRSASVYWHATGIDTDLAADPELAEPFDISVAEAMASGCIPVVFGSVGTAETVENGVSGLHFQDEGDLVITTLRVLAHPDEEWISAMRIAAIKRSECFAKAAFCRHWQALIDRLQLEI